MQFICIFRCLFHAFQKMANTRQHRWAHAPPPNRINRDNILTRQWFSIVGSLFICLVCVCFISIQMPFYMRSRCCHVKFIHCNYLERCFEKGLVICAYEIPIVVFFFSQIRAMTFKSISHQRTQRSKHISKYWREKSDRYNWNLEKQKTKET